MSKETELQEFVNDVKIVMSEVFTKQEALLQLVGRLDAYMEKWDQGEGCTDYTLNAAANISFDLHELVGMLEWCVISLKGAEEHLTRND